MRKLFMKEPNIQEITKRLAEYSQNLKDNSQIGNSKIVLAFSEMVTVMAWSSEQQEKHSKIFIELNSEVKGLKENLKKYSSAATNESKTMRYLAYALGIVAILQLLIAYGQYKLGEVQVDVSRDQTGLESATWEYEKMRNDRLEARVLNGDGRI